MKKKIILEPIIYHIVITLKMNEFTIDDALDVVKIDKHGEKNRRHFRSFIYVRMRRLVETGVFKVKKWSNKKENTYVKDESFNDVKFIRKHSEIQNYFIESKVKPTINSEPAGITFSHDNESFSVKELTTENEILRQLVVDLSLAKARLENALTLSKKNQ